MRTFRQKAIAGGSAVAIASAAFIAPWEGYEPVAKHERIDPAGVITYGYGTTNYDISDLKPGDRISEADARKLLGDRLAQKYVPPLRQCIPAFDAQPLSRQVAFASAAYNLGDKAVCRSSMANKINAGDVRGACDAFLLYDRANGKVIAGLHNRRVAERKLCLQEG